MALEMASDPCTPVLAQSSWANPSLCAASSPHAFSRAMQESASRSIALIGPMALGAVAWDLTSTLGEDYHSLQDLARGEVASIVGCARVISKATAAASLSVYIAYTHRDAASNCASHPHAIISLGAISLIASTATALLSSYACFRPARSFAVPASVLLALSSGATLASIGAARGSRYTPSPSTCVIEVDRWFGLLFVCPLVTIAIASLASYLSYSKSVPSSLSSSNGLAILDAQTRAAIENDETSFLDIPQQRGPALHDLNAIGSSVAVMLLSLTVGTVIAFGGWSAILTLAYLPIPICVCSLFSGQIVRHCRDSFIPSSGVNPDEEKAAAGRRPILDVSSEFRAQRAGETREQTFDTEHGGSIYNQSSPARFIKLLAHHLSAQSLRAMIQQSFTNEHIVRHSPHSSISTAAAHRETNNIFTGDSSNSADAPSDVTARVAPLLSNPIYARDIAAGSEVRQQSVAPLSTMQHNDFSSVSNGQFREALTPYTRRRTTSRGTMPMTANALGTMSESERDSNESQRTQNTRGHGRPVLVEPVSETALEAARLAEEAYHRPKQIIEPEIGQGGHDEERRRSQHAQREDGSGESGDSDPDPDRDRIVREAKEGRSVDLSRKIKASGRPSWAVAAEKKKASHKRLDEVDADLISSMLDERGFSRSASATPERTEAEQFEQMLSAVSRKSAKEAVVASAPAGQRTSESVVTNQTTTSSGSFGPAEIGANPRLRKNERLRTVLAMGSQPRENPWRTGELSSGSQSDGQSSAPSSSGPSSSASDPIANNSLPAPVLPRSATTDTARPPSKRRITGDGSHDDQFAPSAGPPPLVSHRSNTHMATAASDAGGGGPESPGSSAPGSSDPASANASFDAASSDTSSAVRHKRSLGASVNSANSSSGGSRLIGNRQRYSADTFGMR